MMNSDTRPKYLLIAEAMESRIRLGEWASDRFPSVRDVAAQHHVSIVTASRAMQVLRDKGMIRTVGRSGCYVEPGAHGGVTEQFALCQRICPGPWRNATAGILPAGFAAASEHVGSRLDTESFSLGFDAGHQEIQQFARRARAEKLAGLFLFPSRLGESAALQDEALVSALDKAGIPVVLLGRNLRGHASALRHDLVTGDDFTGAQALTGHLLGRGCGRIAFVDAPAGGSHDSRLAGYLLAAHHAGMSPIVLSSPAGLSPRQAHHQIVEQLLARRADGVVCHHDDVAIGVIMELMSRGMSVPNDLAVAGFDDLPIGDAFALGVTTHKLPAEGIAREAFRLMRRRLDQPRAPVVHSTVPGWMVVRESSFQTRNSELGTRNSERKTNDS